MPQESRPVRLLAISPHLDDAVLSFGAGLMKAAQDGAAVTVFTVFAGTATPPYSPAAERMHAVWGFEPDADAPRYRREEDIAALGHLGVGHRHGGFLDSIYRTLPDGQWLVGPVAGGQELVIKQRSAESNRALVAAVTADIGSVIDEFAPTLLVSCAAIGGHVDHEIARDAALFAAREKNIPIRLWEDLPYAMFRPGEVELPAGFRLGTSGIGTVRIESGTRKFQAVERYSSQLLMLNGRDNDLLSRMAEYGRKISPHDGYGEMYWPVVQDEEHDDEG